MPQYVGVPPGDPARTRNPTKGTLLLRWLSEHPGAPVCSLCLGVAHDEGHCGRELDLPGVTGRIDALVHQINHVLGQTGTCETHGRVTHYVLTGGTNETRQRLPLDDRKRAKVQELYQGRDAYTGHKPARGEVDHRVPIQSLRDDEAALDWSDDAAVRGRCMILSKEHNSIKNRTCHSCRDSGNRPPFFGVRFWFRGNQDFTLETGCDGCGWAWPEEWRETLETRLSHLSATDAPQRPEGAAGGHLHVE